MVYPTRSNLQNEHSRCADVRSKGHILNELSHERLSSNRVAEKNTVREMRAWSIEDRVINLSKKSLFRHRIEGHNLLSEKENTTVIRQISLKNAAESFPVQDEH